MKLLALLANREALANPQFEGIVARYEAVVRLAQTATTRPEVMFGHMEDRDEFHLIRSGFVLAQLIEDAGGHSLAAGNGLRIWRQSSCMGVGRARLNHDSRSDRQ